MIVRSTIQFRQKIATLYRSDPAIPIAIFQVIKVGVMIISFLFKNDVPVSLVVVSVFIKVEKVIKKIQQIKGQNKQFKLLTQVDGFVVNHFRIAFKPFRF